MASVTENRPADRVPEEVSPAEERFVDEQIRRTRRALKLVDFTAGLITLVIGVLAYLLIMAVLEHWIVPGGWSVTARAVLFAALVGGAGWFCWRIFWPLLSQPINPAFAAKTIEESSPSLKNSLLNFLLLREHRRQISRQVYQAIEQQAAQRLSQVSLDTVIDRSAILRLGYVLVAVVALCALYRVISPKDPLASAGRLLMPWSDIPVPSRVQILDVKPGDTSAARGEQLVVTAEILGAAEEEPVRLRYSASDQQVVDQDVLMTPQENGLRYEGRLPGRIALGGSGGIQNDLTYWIEAGDARSASYKVTVFSQPTLVVEKIRYEYPIYTRYAPREVENTGDISAVEGTVVTITAVANQPIDSAHVDFDADGRHDLLMKSEDRQAGVSFPLELDEDRRTPRYESYVLRYKTVEGRHNPAPPKYRIDVQQDYAPEIELLAPEQETLDVGLHDEVVIEVQARDPDFAVHNVAILGTVAGERVLKESLLSQDRTGRFVGQMKLVPAELNLKAGDVLEYWGAAADNRRPEPNLAFTKHQKLRIIGPGDQGGQQQQGEQGQGQGNPQEGQNGEQGEAGQQGGAGQGEEQANPQEQQGQGEAGAGQQGESQGENADQQTGLNGEANDSSEDGKGESQGKAGGESQEDGEAQENSQPSAGEAGGKPSSGEGQVSPEGDDDGEAFERIAEHFREEQGDSEGGEGASGEQRDSPQEGAEASGEQSAGKEGGVEGSQPEDTKPGDMKGAEGDESSRQEPAAGQQEGENQQASDDAGGEMQQDQGPAGAGDKADENQGSPNAVNEQKPSDKPTDDAAGREPESQEAPAPSESKHESDTQGEQSGDRSGGGQEGGGQKADEEGTGGAGEHQAAEDGASQAAEQGEGEAGAEAGGEQQAEAQTGESSESQPGQGGKQGDQSGQQQPGGEQAGSEAQPQGESSTEPTAAGGQPQTGGTGGSSSTPPPTGETAPGDEANLDYAREQTALVLDKLEDQLRKQQVDKDLLEKLGWTTDELRRFVERWKNLKSQAEGTGPQADNAQQELDAALRSLGLGRKQGPGFESRTAKDKLRDLQDAYRGRTPLEFQERMRKYVKGTATAPEE